MARLPDMARLPVYFEQRLVGKVDVDGSGPGFAYDPDWLALKGAFPISTTMPFRSERIGAATFLPWAANLLPESEQLRTLGQLLGMARGDVIGLLSTIGGDTAGALSFGQSGRTSSVQWRPVEAPQALEKLIEDLPNKPFLVGDEGVSMSLAGAQIKLAVALDGAGNICIPMNGSASTHILKPDVPRLPGSVQNEAFCLTLARRMKLAAAAVTTARAGSRTYLLVSRYDRKEIAGRWRRLHQEDFCQALGRHPSDKYEANQTGIAGPTLNDMLDATRRHMPATDIVRLLDMAIFNVLACNTDAHAKNYGIMIRAGGAALAPIYDVMCGEVWGSVTKNLAQRIAGEKRGERLDRTLWERFGRQCGLNPTQVVGRVDVLARAALAEAEAAAAEVAAMPGGPHESLDGARLAVERRARALLAQLQLGDRKQPDVASQQEGALLQA
jgi:serine/threonine-protein kinase HipA